MITDVTSTGIVALGAFAPPESCIVSNATIAARTDTSVAWIESKTGIKERRHSPPGTPTSKLAAEAVEDLDRRYPGALDSVGTVIVATSTKDQPIPHTAAFVHRALQLPPMATFDVDAVCTGFIQALDIAVCKYKRGREPADILVIGVDRYPAIVDPADRASSAIFGEAAGAVVVSAVPSGQGIRAIDTVTHSQHVELVQVLGGGTRRPLDASSLASGLDRFRMTPAWQVGEYAVRELPPIVTSVLDDARIDRNDVDRWIPHQAHPVLINTLAASLDVDATRFAITADRFGNTGCASIPFTLAQSHTDNPLKPGETVVFLALGGGMTVGVAVLVWGDQ